MPLSTGQFKSIYGSENNHLDRKLDKTKTFPFRITTYLKRLEDKKLTTPTEKFNFAKIVLLGEIEGLDNKTTSDKLEQLGETKLGELFKPYGFDDDPAIIVAICRFIENQLNATH
jgi:hypothetical protein